MKKYLTILAGSTIACILANCIIGYIANSLSLSIVAGFLAYIGCNIYLDLRLKKQDAKKFLWEILVPAILDGDDISVAYHQFWNQKVCKITSGLTILTPVKGSWSFNLSDDFLSERMIPVRIACTWQQIREIAEITANYYKQECIMFYKLSDDVTIKYYGRKDAS